MRRKIKELINKEEGFTLVELLAVIVILGIIVAIAIPSIGSVISKTQTKANEAERDLVVDAARLYVTAEEIEIATTGTEIEVSDLKSKGYIEERDETKELGGYVTVKLETNGTHTYDGENVTKSSKP